jgi:GT2 family glycosyltransferase
MSVRREAVAPARRRVVLPHHDSPLVSVLVVAWRSAPYVLECLAAVQESVERIAYEVVLVLNEPTPALEALVASYLEHATIVRTRANVGFAGAVNLAASQARGELLVLLNDDATPHPGWLEHLVDCALRRPGAAAVGSKVLLADGTIQEAGSVVWSDGWTFTVGRGLPGTTKRFDYERRVDYCSGCSLLVRRRDFEEVGGLDESYYPAYFEDADLCLKLAARGRAVWFQPRSVVTHRESASTHSRYRQFLLERNHELFVARWSAELAGREERVMAHEPAVERAVWRALGEPLRVLVIDDRVPIPAIGSGFARMADAIDELMETGRCHVALLCSLEGGEEQSDILAERGVEVLDEPLEEHLAKQGLSYSLVVVSRPHNYVRFAPVIRRLLPGVPVVYDAEALYARRIERQAAVTADFLERRALEAEADQMRSDEAAIAADADFVVCISEEEAAFFETHAPGRVEVNAPFLAGPSPTSQGFEERAEIGFVAGWFAGERSPNADGLLWFARKVLPLVRARVGGVRLVVTGAFPPRNVTRLEGEAVSFIGEVDDLAAFYGRVRAVVVPLRYGAGVKIKTIEALQYAVPTVATSVGAEGVPVDDPAVLVVEDDPARFAEALAEIVGDRAAWERRRRLLLDQHRRWAAQGHRAFWPGVLDRFAVPVRVLDPLRIGA